MACILHIETATRVCSVGLTTDAKMISFRIDHSQQYSHSTFLASFIQDVLNETGFEFNKLDAIAVSMGPGSYTGLRIGVSAAKGLCYALDIPLIAVNTLSVLAQNGLQDCPETDFVIPMIDARRMEVYNAIFNSSLTPVRETIAEIIDEYSFQEFLSKGKVLFCGDGVAKCMEVISHPNAIFLPHVSANVHGMAQFAEEKYINKQFENLAYFEPFYLKDFVAGKPNVKGLK
jgi:tRNA threonylcarbamoyladenosine biosynthesis protein TsaB